MNKKTEEFRKKVVENFIEVLEKEPLNWKKGWNNIIVPFNAVSKNDYNGINRFMLTIISLKRGYSDPRFLTFNQVKQMGLKLSDAKGRGIPVEFWFMKHKETRKGVSWDVFNKLNKEEKDEYVLDSWIHYVFNASHVEGIEPYQNKNEVSKINKNALIEKTATNMKLVINEVPTSNSCFYVPYLDCIKIPPRNTFDNEQVYVSSLLHEMAHATGHENRLNRQIKNEMGSEAYAIEELRAEIASCLLSNSFDIELDDSLLENHQAYVQHWIRSLKNKPAILFEAIKEAEKIADYIDYHAGLIDKTKYEVAVKSNDLKKNKKQINEIEISR